MIKKFESFSPSTFDSKFTSVIKDLYPNVIYNDSTWNFKDGPYEINIEKKDRNLRFQINGRLMTTYHQDHFKSINNDFISRMVNGQILRYKEEMDYSNRMKKENQDLLEINREDLQMIFQDLLDLDSIKDFEIYYPSIDQLRIQYISIIFVSNLNLHEISKPKDCLLLSEIYKKLGESIERINSMYGLKVLVCQSKFPNNFYLKIKNDNGDKEV